MHAFWMKPLDPSSNISREKWRNTFITTEGSDNRFDRSFERPSAEAKPTQEVICVSCC